MAAQVGLSTTGQNIANANTPGYSRQVVVQASAPGQNMGYGFLGSGTEVAQIKRYSDDFLTTQVNSAQSSTSSSQAFSAQISQVDNLLADSATGLSPAMQDFFNGVQDLSASPASAAARQAALSGGTELAARFQTLSGRLTEIAGGIDTQISANVTLINSYAKQIAQLNDSIARLGSSNGTPNDLLDQRDLLVADLNKQVKASVLPGDNNTLTVSIGNGQPLVVGNQAFQLAVTSSPTDASRVEVGYVTGSKVTVLPESAFSGGELGGLFEVRAQGLDPARNALGQVATSLALSFNLQHQQGLDQAGVQGGDFFTVAPPLVSASVNNTGSATLTAKVSDPAQLTASDYAVKFDGSNYAVTRQSDNKVVGNIAYVAGTASSATIDGVDYTFSDSGGAPAAGDHFLIRPTINGASGFGMALSDISKIAAGSAAPVTGAAAGNTGTGKISASRLDPNAAVLAAPVTLTFASGPPAVFSASMAATVTSNGVATAYAAGAPIPYNAGANFNFGGVNQSLSGTPANADTFTITAGASGAGDNRNAVLLGNLQSKNILNGGTATYQSGYAQLVSFVGNTTREGQVNGLASATLLGQTQTAQQSVSGVNLDEEAANLLKYQQAYQAAGKVMQIASQMFATLLTLGG